MRPERGGDHFIGQSTIIYAILVIVNKIFILSKYVKAYFLSVLFNVFLYVHLAQFLLSFPYNSFKGRK